MGLNAAGFKFRLRLCVVPRPCLKGPRNCVIVIGPNISSEKLELALGRQRQRQERQTSDSPSCTPRDHDHTAQGCVCEGQQLYGVLLDLACPPHWYEPPRESEFADFSSSLQKEPPNQTLRHGSNIGSSQGQHRMSAYQQHSEHSINVVAVLHSYFLAHLLHK